MGQERDGPSSYGRLTTEEAFALVGNEVRREILLALSEPDRDGLNPPVLSFSELYDRVDADAGTSQFNYHLQQLRGQFVESHDGDTAHLNEEIAGEGGYALRPEGLLLVWTVRSGTVTDDPPSEAFDAGFDCYHCGAGVEATYENAVFGVRCPDCEYHYDYNLTPPGILHDAADEAEILDRVANYNRTVRGGFARGVCPLCGSDVESRFVDADATNYPRRDLREAFVHRSCTHCGNLDYLTVGEFLLTDPGVVSFCLERGVDVTGARLWDLGFAMTDDPVTVRGTDPWDVAFALTLDGDTLEIVLGEGARIVERTVS